MIGREEAGDFWLADTGGSPRPGVLRLDTEQAPTLTLRGLLTQVLRWVNVAEPGNEPTYRGDPVNDRSLHIIHGSTNEGTPVTLIDAQCRGYGGLRPDQQTQSFQGVQAVIGAHLTGRDHQFSGVRVRLQSAAAMLSPASHPSWLTPTPLPDGGDVRLEEDEEGTWLVLQRVTPRSIRGLERQYLRPLATLLSLATGHPVGLLGTHVQEDAEGPWWPVHGAAHRGSDLPGHVEKLLCTADLTPTVIATWLGRTDALGPLPPVVAAAMRGPIALEGRVLELTTVAEGLHRRLRPEAVRFSPEIGRAVRRAAAAAAEEVHAGAGEAVRDFLGHVHGIGYGDRLLGLAAMAESAIPGVTGHSKRWKKAVYNARNDFAHRASTGWFHDDDYDKYITVALSLGWVLHAVLLQEAGVPDDVLTRSFRTYERYQLFLEQAEVWQPSIYKEDESAGSGS
ncbi:MAG TPA: HEPN domain-containing protein [Catenuloplanes sp.]|jgi:hypothetical protein